MPWQHHVANIAGEVDPATGHLWYREVIVTVPRQSGKTTLLLPKWVWRAEAAAQLGGRQRMLYAAQTKNEATEKFDEDFIEDLAASRIMRGRYRVSNNQGRKRVRFQSGSILSPVATTTRSGHGKTLDDGTLDEAFAQVDNRVEAAWRPAMVTRPSAQLWVVSTAGTAESTYFRGKVLRGRAIVEANNPRSRTAYIEYSAPEGADPQDPATWWACMPALGYTQTVENVQHELETIEGGLVEFSRAYCNIWPDGSLTQVLPAESWENCRDPESRRDGPPVLAVDVSPDRAHAAVSYCAVRGDGLPMVQTVRHGDGVAWVPEAVAQLAAGKGAIGVVLDSVGPVSNLKRPIEEELEEVRLAVPCPVRMMTTSDVCDAFGDFYDAVITEQVKHTGQDELDEAMKTATVRFIGARKAWARRHDGDITPLVSATHAHWGLKTTPDLAGPGAF